MSRQCFPMRVASYSFRHVEVISSALMRWEIERSLIEMGIVKQKLRWHMRRSEMR